MKLHIISSEIVKPYSPTPHHLKTHKLSLLDQLTPNIYFPFVFFYSGVGKNTTEISHHLKKSLSQTLTHYYPFSGQIKDDYSVDCNDYGVPFIETEIASKMDEVHRNQEIDILEQLLPFKPHEKLSTEVNLAVQLNHFDCGGVAIGICCTHLIADATAGIYFLKHWAAVACGSSMIKDVVIDCTSIFPPNDLIPSITRSINEKQRSIECINKKFTFDGTKIAALREKFDMTPYADRPTRFELVSALIWGALIAIARESNESPPIATIPVNLRRRMDPPLPDHCIGNIYHAGAISWSTDEGIDYKRLVRKIQEYVKMVNMDYVRQLYEGGAFVNHYTKAAEEFLNTSNKMTVFGFTAPIRLPYNEVDFGWGKPTRITCPMRLSNTAALFSIDDDKGIEASVGLPMKEMAKFEQDPGILAYASFNPCCRSRI